MEKEERNGREEKRNRACGVTVSTHTHALKHLHTHTYIHELTQIQKTN